MALLGRLVKGGVTAILFPLTLVGLARREIAVPGEDLRKQQLHRTYRRHSDVMVIVESLQLPRDTRLLDVGSGKGNLLRRLSQAGFTELGGCDWLPDTQVASMLPSGVAYSCVDLNGDGLSAWGNGSLDFVLCSDVLEHLESPAFILREFARVLRPGGAALITPPNAFNLYERLFTLCTGNVNRYKTERKTTSYGHISMLPLRVLRSLSRRCGLTVEPIGRGYWFLFGHILLPWRGVGHRLSFVACYLLRKPEIAEVSNLQ